MAPQDEYVALFPLLADYWKKDFSKLPNALQARVSTWVIDWGNLNLKERQNYALKIDYNNDPVLAGK